MKYIGPPVFIFVLTGLSFAVIQAEELSQVFERVKNNVATINAQQKSSHPSTTTVNNLSVQGTGVLIADRYEVMTAADLVQTANWIEVGFEKTRAVAARVESSALQADVALLELEMIPKIIEGAKFGNSDNVSIGQTVFVVGISSGSGPRMIVCHVTGRWKPPTVMENFLQVDFLEIDSKLARQDAGAPLFDSNGEVIGIVSNVLSNAAGFTGMGFAIPSNLAVKLMLNEPFFWSGISGRLLSGPSSRFFKLPQEKGFLIEKISNSSPSSRLGLRAGTKTTIMDGKPVIIGGDVVLEVDGISLNAEDALVQIRKHLRTIVNGGTLLIKIFRDGKIIKLTSTYDH